MFRFNLSDFLKIPNKWCS